MIVEEIYVPKPSERVWAFRESVNKDMKSFCWVQAETWQAVLYMHE